MLKQRLMVFFRHNLLLAAFLTIIGFSLFISAFKVFNTNSQTIYIRVKLSQGLWWASSSRPAFWFAQALKKDEAEYNLFNKPTATIIKIRYYPYLDNNYQYDVYIDVKISAGYDKKSGRYTYKRSTIGVGAPIDFEFPSTQVTGTIIGIANQPFEEKYIDKVVTITKRSAYPWEYEAIKIGDTFFNGENILIEILDKQAIDTSIMSSDAYGNINPVINEPRKYITVNLKMKLKNVKGQLILGEEQVVRINSILMLGTDTINLSNFSVAAID